MLKSQRVVEQEETQMVILSRKPREQSLDMLFATLSHVVGANEVDFSNGCRDACLIIDQQLDAIVFHRLSNQARCFMIVIAKNREAITRAIAQRSERLAERSGRTRAFHGEEISSQQDQIRFLSNQSFDRASQ